MSEPIDPTPNPDSDAAPNIASGPNSNAPTPPAPPIAPDSPLAASPASPADPASAAPANPPASAGTAPAPAAPSSPAKPPQRKLRRWGRRLLVAAITFVIAMRIGLTLLLPWTLGKIAGFYGLTFAYERADLYLFSGDAGLWHVKVTQASDGAPVALADYCRADISPLQLFRGLIAVQRLEADGVELTVQRNADGSIPLLQKFLAQSTPAPASASAAKSSNQPMKFDLTPPVAIDALRLTHCRAHVIDLAVSPALDARIETNLRFSDLASLIRPARLSIDVLPNPLMDSVVIDAEGNSTAKAMKATFSFTALGLHPGPLAGYLAPVGIHGTARGITARGSGEIAANVLDADKTAIGGSLKLTDLSLSADGQETASLHSLTLAIDSVSPKGIAIGKLDLDGGSFNAYRSASGGFGAAGMEWSPSAATAPSTQPAVKIADGRGAASANSSPQGGPLTSSSVLSPPPSPLAASPSPIAAATATTQSPPTAQLAPAPWSLGQLSVRNFTASFHDAAVSPAAQLGFVVNELTLRQIVDDTSKPETPLTLSGKFSAPGMVQFIDIEGTCRPFAQKKTAELSFSAQGVRPDAVRPYLDLLGVQSTLESGSLTARITADVSLPIGKPILVNAQLAKVLWTDEGKELTSLDEAKIAGLSLDLTSAPGAIGIAAIDVSGPRLAARREASGALWAAGFRVLAPPATPPAGSATAVPAASAPKAAVKPAAAKKAVAATQPAAPAIDPADALALLPKLQVDRLTWTGVHVDLDDEYESPPATVSIDDAGFELKHLLIDFDPHAPTRDPGRFHAWMHAPGLAGEMTVDGAVSQRPAGLAADVEVAGKHLSAALSSSYLKPLYIEPTLHDGTFHAKAHIDVQNQDGILVANASAESVSLSDAGEELLGVDKAAISDISIKPDAISVGHINVNKPRATVMMESSGAISAGGFKMIPRPPAPKKSAFAAAATPNSVAVSGRVSQAVAPSLARGAAGEGKTLAPATQPANGADQAPLAPPFVVSLDGFTVTDGALRWIDRSAAPVADIIARADGVLSHLSFGGSPSTAPFDFTFKADGIADQIHLQGSATATPQSGAITLQATGAGIREGALKSYLPPGMAVDLKDGRFRAKVDAAAAIDDQGVASGHLNVTDVDYRDAGSASPLFRMDEARVSLAKLDASKEVRLGEVSVLGAEASARRGADGAIHAMGVMISSAPAAAPGSAATRPAAGPATLPAAQADAAPITLVATTQPAIAATFIAKQKYPLIGVDKLDLNLRRFTFTDESRPESMPLAVQNLRLVARRPIRVLGKDPGMQSPIDLGLNLSVDKVIDSVAVTLQSSPFGSQPTLTLDLTGAGLHGDGLLALAPELKPKLDGHELTDGRFGAHLETTLRVDRLDPLDFSLSHGCDADFLLKDLKFRNTADGEVLAGLDEVRSEGIHIDAKKGDVRLKSLEVSNITAVAIRQADGIHAGGMIVKLASPETQPAGPTTAPAAAPAPVVASPASHGPHAGPSVRPAAPVAVAPPATATASAAPVAAAAPAGGEILISKFLVSGMNVRLEDRSVSPPLVVPINQFDLDVSNLSSRATVEDKLMKFSLLVGAGKVDLPKRLERNALAGGLRDAAALLGGKKVATAPVMEKRDLFSQVEASGEISLYPRPRGRVKMSVSGFDLASLKSEAREIAGVDLTNGVFDMSEDLKLPGDGSMQSQSSFSFTDMDLAESPNGPISRFLHLPAPLNVVMGALTDADGSITAPIGVKLEKGHVSGGAISGAAVNAFGAIVTTALASTAQKGVGAVTDTIGAVTDVIPGGNVVTSFLARFVPWMGDNKAKDLGPFKLAFAPGDDAFSPEVQSQLAQLRQRMLDEPNLDLTLRQDLGWNDVGRAEIRANPSREDTVSLIVRLTDRRQDLLRRRSQLIGQSRTDLATRSPAEAAHTLDALHGAERDLAATEDALDKMYDLLRPGAARQRDRRTRQASIDIGQSRLLAVRSALSAAGDLDARLHSPKATFNPSEMEGSVTVTLTVKKKG